MKELIIFYHGQPILKEKLSTTVTLGSQTNNDICLLDSVLAYHAKIEVTPQAILVVEKEGPVFINGERILGSQKLLDGDLFDLGAYRCQLFEAGRASISGSARKTATATAHGHSASTSSIPTIYFLPPIKKRFRRALIIIGRSPASDLAIDNNYVSSQHAEIFVHEGQLMIRDLHSRNGTFVNDYRITERLLPATGTIRLGKYGLTYQTEDQAAETSDIPGVVLPSLTEGGPPRKLVGNAVAFREVMKKLKKIAPTDDPTLLLGETGVGKDLYSQYLHAEHPKRKNHPFIIVNCAAIPPSLAESQLFGHTRGAFSGAVHDHKGFFEQAHKGTLFLDEVGELPLESQSRLLRVIEDGLIRPIGSQKEFKVDVRMIFATNRNLEDARFKGQFREDLFQRFQWVIDLPTLRQRSEDIPLLVRYFISQHSPAALSIDQDTLFWLESLPWKGNIRELNRAVRRAITNAISNGNPVLSSADFDLRTESGEIVTSALPPGVTSIVRKQKRDSLLKTLKSLQGNISAAAQKLGVSRVTMHKWINEDKIDVEKMKK